MPPYDRVKMLTISLQKPSVLPNFMMGLDQFLLSVSVPLVSTGPNFTEYYTGQILCPITVICI